MRPRLAHSLIVGTVAIPALAIRNWRYPLLRLTSAPANSAVLAISVLLPILGLVAAIRSEGRVLRWVLALPLTLVALAGVLVAALAAGDFGFAIKHGYASGFRPTDRLATHGSALAAYDTDCGPCAYGLEVRQETPLVPGVVVVRTVYRQAHCRGGRLQKVSEERIRVLPDSDGVTASGPWLTLVDGRWQVSEEP